VTICDWCCCESQTHTRVLPVPVWPQPTDSNIKYHMNAPAVIGESNFTELRRSNAFLIDKSMLIHDFMGVGHRGTPKVCLILRPRRFGKTLNASMLAAFVRPRADHSLFRGLRIYREQEFIQQHLGQYACISISLAMHHTGRSITVHSRL